MLSRSSNLREKLRKGLYPYYRLSAPLRPLPNAVIIGGMKCGTTSLNAWLRDRPGVAFSSVKEIHFFDKQFDKGEAWYRSHFPILESLLGARCVIEATPSYLYRAESVAPRMQAMIPEARLVVMLRDPIKRAISQYGHHVRHGKEERTLSEALLSDTGSNPKNPNHYKCRGLYAQQIKRFLQHYDRSQLLVIKSETFFADPAPVYEQVQRFFGLDPVPLKPSSKPRNVGQQKHTVPDEVIAHLADYYREPNRELSQLLPDFPIW